MKAIKAIYNGIDKFNDFLGRIFSVLSLAILAVIMCEVILRRIFNRPQIWTQDLIVMLFACYIILISAYGLQKKAFVAVDVVYAMFPVRVQHILHIVTYAIFLVPFLMGLVPASWTFFLNAYTTGEQTYSVWAAPTWPVKLCLFVGLVLLAIQAVSEILKHVEGLVRERKGGAGMTAILEQLQGLVAAAEIPAGTLGVALILGLFGLMVVGLVLGQELAFVLGGAGVIVGWLAWGTPGVTIAMTKIYDQMQSYSMVAIPMFVLMANFLTHSKVADGLFESIRYLLGPLKGGLGLAVILVSTVFAATTGIVGASVVTMGMLSLPVLLRSGYKPSLACGMVCAGGSLGILIPPSIMLVSMGSYAEVSVGKIFFAAMVPGLSLSLGYIIYLMVVCHIHPDWGPAMSPEELAEMPLKKRITGSLINLIPPLILIFGVLGSIFGGIATPTEAAGIGALFSLILAIFYKQFSWKMLYESLIDTAKTTAMVFIILFGAAAFTGVFMSLDGDQIIADWVLSMGIGKWGAFAIMMVIMFLLGMFIDWLGIVMIVFPIFLPIMDTFGFDRLWLVAVSATLLQTCFMTPPFGFALFYVKGILPPSIKIQEVYRGVIPFIIIICIVTALCAVFPPLVTWLPSMLAS